jgi:hypothetical protein
MTPGLDPHRITHGLSIIPHPELVQPVRHWAIESVGLEVLIIARSIGKDADGLRLTSLAQRPFGCPTGYRLQLNDQGGGLVVIG